MLAYPRRNSESLAVSSVIFLEYCLNKIVPVVSIPPGKFLKVLEFSSSSRHLEIFGIQIQIWTCRARLTNCPGALTICQKAMRNRFVFVVSGVESSVNLMYRSWIVLEFAVFQI